MNPERRNRAEDLLGGLFRAPLDPGYAEAAGRRAARTEPPPRWRTAGGRSARAFALASIGFLLAVAYHQAMADEPGASRVRGNLVTDVLDRQRQTDDLQRQADRLRDEVDRARENALAGGGEVSRLRDLAAGTGLGKVTGDGAVVRLADAPAKIDPVTGAQDPDNKGIVLDRDLQDIANGLWQAGAEAIAINGQRLTTITAIRQAGGVILVDFRPVTGPYEVAAVGPDDLVERFNGSPTAKRFRRYVQVYRMQFSVRDRDRLVLGAAPGPRLRFAHPPSRSSPQPSTVPSAPVPSAPVPSRTGGR